jgi:hypothetical protein
LIDWFAVYRQTKTALCHLAVQWERTPDLPAEAPCTLYALSDRVESLPHNATEAELWAAVHQAIEDGKEDAKRWKEGDP